MGVQSKFLEYASNPSFRTKVLKATAAFGGLLLLKKLGSAYLHSRASHGERKELVPVGKKKKRTFDEQFLRQLWTLIKIMVPGVFTKEAAILGTSLALRFSLKQLKYCLSESLAIVIV